MNLTSVDKREYIDELRTHLESLTAANLTLSEAVSLTNRITFLCEQLDEIERVGR